MPLFYSIQSNLSMFSGNQAKALSVLSAGKGCLMDLDSFIFRCLGDVWLLLNRVTLLTYVHHWSITDLTSFSVKLLTSCSTSYICITNYSCLGAEPCLCPHCLNILCFSSVVPFAKYIWIPSLSSSLFVVPTSFVICRFKNSLRFHSSILKTKVLILGTHPNLEMQRNQEMHAILKQWTFSLWIFELSMWCEHLWTLLV